MDALILLLAHIRTDGTNMFDNYLVIIERSVSV